jgi:serine/threonine-protein kinase
MLEGDGERVPPLSSRTRSRPGAHDRDFTMIGDRLGKWIIFKELGRGGMGRVYLAQEELGDRQAAIKILAAELAQDAGFLQRFQREIDILSQLDHPNIVHFFESGCENNLFFYAMEYVEGQTLEQRLLEEGRLPWKDVLNIAIQVCAALKHAHDHGTIHRDLKPPNLMVTADGTVKLTDFGIAKIFASSHLTATGGVVGTAEFLSPEQAAGKPVTKRSDLYSLGVVLYALLTGRTPFTGESFADLLHKHLFARFDPPGKVLPELPYEIDEMICQLLEKDPAKRPADALVLGRQLEGIRRKLERKASATDPGLRKSGTVAENQGMPQLEGGVGPATLMSRLMREELEREKRGGAIWQMFNRTLVILPLFVLVVGVITWNFWPLDEEQLFRRGSEMMKSEHRVDWQRAWREYFEPLNTRFPDHPYKKEVEQFQRKIEESLNPAPPVPSEAQRFYKRGERLLIEGDPAAARKMWQNLVAVFGPEESAKEWVQRAEQGIAAIDRRAAAKERWEPVRAALKRAAALRDQGKNAEAERIWQGIEELYRADPTAQDILQEVQAARKK